MGTLAKGALVWLIAFLALGYLGEARLGTGTRFVLRLVVTVVAICVAAVVAVKGSFDPRGGPDRMNLLLPLVAAGLEQYLEFVRDLLERLEKHLRGALGRIGRVFASKRSGAGP